MLAVGISLFSVAAFAAVLYFTKIERVAKHVMQQSYEGIAAITNPELNDDQKETAVKKSGFAVLLGGGAIFWRFAACLIAAFLPIYLADITGIASQEAVFSLMLRLDYIIIISVVLIIIVWLVKRNSASKEAADNATNYSLAERLLHMMAFASPSVQKIAAKLDDVVFNTFHPKQQNLPPIFITSLARGGTTALLNAFSDLPNIATHTYRDMPFITAPYLWNRLGSPFRRKVERKERAHGDGLLIDLDSPEAFDEVYWRLYWPEKYYNNKIALWDGGDVKSTAIDRFAACFRKIVHIRKKKGGYYLSKNNANIARICLIDKAFPGAKIIVPVRSPAPHAASLLRQHENFLKQHAEDDFFKRYMYDIGHLEFGLLQTPIAFEGFNHEAYNPKSPDYWLAYWIAAFSEVKNNLDKVHIVLQDDLREQPTICMQRLFQAIQIDDQGRDFSEYFHQTPDKTDISVFSPELLAAANKLYKDIVEQSKSSTA